MNIHFRITNYCNLQCKNCWGSNKRNTTHMMPDMITKALNYLAPIGYEDKINITGGEPTINPYFENIMEKLLQTMAFKTISTNAYNLDSNLINSLLEFNRIQLPMDGSNSLKFSSFRGNTVDYLPKVSHVVSLLKYYSYSGIVKFGTVIEDNDLSDLKNIYRLINGFSLTNVEWRLYPLLKKNRQYDSIIFNDELLQIENNCKKNKIYFSVFTPEDRNDNYIFINPNGVISTIKNNVEIVIKQL